MSPIEILAMNVAVVDEGTRSPAQAQPPDVFPKAVIDQFARNEAKRNEAWQSRVAGLTCKVAAEETKSRDGALLIWIDANNELRAQRVSREHSVFREFVPAYLRRTA